MASIKAGDGLAARLEQLSSQVDTALVRAQTRPRQSASAPATDSELVAALRRAEDSAQLQSQRCQSLEDRVAELEAALVGAAEQRLHAEAMAESARQQASRALDQLDAQLHGQAHVTIDSKLNATLQGKLLEVERLTSELTSLRSANEDWRGKARSYRRDLDRVSLELERTSSHLSELRARDEHANKRLAELERLVADQRRELDLAERRAKHLREHMTTR